MVTCKLGNEITLHFTSVVGAVCQEVQCWGSNKKFKMKLLTGWYQRTLFKENMSCCVLTSMHTISLSRKERK